MKAKKKVDDAAVERGPAEEIYEEAYAKHARGVDREDELRIYRKAREFGWIVYRCINRDDGFYAVIGGGEIWEGPLEKVEGVLDSKKTRNEAITLHDVADAFDEPCPF